MTVGAATGQNSGKVSASAPTSALGPGEVPRGQAAGTDSAGVGRGGGPEELELVRRAQAGDRAAFGTFVMLTQDRLYTVLVRIVGDREEARELAQETYLKAFGSLSAFRGDSAPYTWLYRIAVNLAIARLRKVRRQRVFSLDQPSGVAATGGKVSAGREPADPGGTPADALLAAEQARQVVVALGRLDSEYRTVLVLRDVDQLDYREIADVLQLPIGTVKSRLFRARLALREEMLRYFGSENRSSAAAKREGGKP
jgi:RNA polymerase sigma-70 factor (ECF subfamily)